MLAGTCFAQTIIPNGTKLRVRLEQSLSSASAVEGQRVELTVTESVKIADSIAIPEGSQVTGTVTKAVPKRRLVRSGHLDFSIDRDLAADGEWVALRYATNKKSGNSQAVKAGILAADVAVLVPNAAPVLLLMKGKDVVVRKG